MTTKRARARARQPRADDTRATRERLLHAAGEVFADRGFDGATVREICGRARANVAAVNYHFKDKHELYLEVFKTASCVTRTEFEFGAIMQLRGGPREKLSAFVHAFLDHVLGPGRPAWQGKLMAREMAEPTIALDYVVDHMIRPTFAVLQAIVAEVIGGKPDDDPVRFAGASIIGQCLFYKHAEEVNLRLYPQMQHTPEMVRQIADHVAEFSWQALQGLARHAKKKGGRA